MRVGACPHPYYLHDCEILSRDVCAVVLVPAKKFCATENLVDANGQKKYFNEHKMKVELSWDFFSIEENFSYDIIFIRKSSICLIFFFQRAVSRQIANYSRQALAIEMINLSFSHLISPGMCWSLAFYLLITCTSSEPTNLATNSSNLFGQHCVWLWRMMVSNWAHFVAAVRSSWWKYSQHNEFSTRQCVIQVLPLQIIIILFINVSSDTKHVGDGVNVCVVSAGDIFKLILITIAAAQSSAEPLWPWWW